MPERDQQESILDFTVVAKIFAGDESMASLGEMHGREAIYVTTGAVVPEGYDAVIPVEETSLLETADGTSSIQIVRNKVLSVLNTKPWTWIRTIGCDIPADSIVLSRGEVIQPVHLALLTQIGVSLQHVRVKELVRVGVLSTGNELIAIIIVMQLTWVLFLMMKGLTKSRPNLKRHCLTKVVSMLSLLQAVYLWEKKTLWSKYLLKVWAARFTLEGQYGWLRLHSLNILANLHLQNEHEARKADNLHHNREGNQWRNPPKACIRLAG
jgi:large-conductance mechanosensitive channel